MRLFYSLHIVKILLWVRECLIKLFSISLQKRNADNRVIYGEDNWIHSGIFGNAGSRLGRRQQAVTLFSVLVLVLAVASASLGLSRKYTAQIWEMDLARAAFRVVLWPNVCQIGLVGELDWLRTSGVFYYYQGIGYTILIAIVAVALSDQNSAILFP